MADDALRMQAEIVDKFSGPLKSLQTQLRGISGGPGVKQLKKDLEEVQGHMAKTATVAKDMLNPALAGFGIAALTAGGAIAGIGSALRGFSADTTNLSYLSREVGIGAGKLRELQSVAGRFNLDPSQIARSTRYFADQIDQMHRNRGEAYNFLLQQSSKDPTGNVAKWTQSIKTARTNAEAYQKTLDMIASVKDPLQRGDLAEKLLGDRSLGALGSEGLAGLHKQQEQAQKDLGSFGKAAEDAAIVFERQIQSLRDQLRGLRDDLGPDLLQPLNAGLTELGGWLREHKGDIREGIVDGLAAAKTAIQQFPWAEAKAGAAAFFGDIKTFGQETATAIRSVGDALGVVKDLLHGNVGDALKKLGKIDKDTDLGLGKDRPAGRIQDGMRGDLAPLMLRQGDLQKQLAILDENIARKENQPDPMGEGHVVASDERQRRDKLTDEIKKLAEEIKRKREQDEKTKSELKADPASFDGGGFGGARIVKASLGGGGFGGGPGGGLGVASRGGGGGNTGSGADHPLRQRGGGLGGDPGEPPAVGGYTGNDGRRAARSGMTAAGRANVASWMEFMRRPADQGGMGYTQEQARGQIAMMQGESGLNLNPAAMGDKDSRGVPHAFGTVQWSDAKGNDRFPRLRALATEMRKDWRDRSVQQEMYRREMMGRYRGVYSRIIASQRGEQSLWNGITGYENPQKHGLAYAIRKPFLDRLRRDGDTAGAKPTERRSALMGRARAAAQAGGAAKAEGQVHVNVNAPPGWRASTVSKGELFREVKLNRGNAMQLASQEA
ncbi:phage tail tip lysozyme [Methylobacterium sp. J-030]|uniref:phage tail tip lysozyme n=1 Tax=Methylobacterium sp. J-030 TaxID=2836627 RepID=UPI001FBB90C3|nr:phage tail tip lysozyme [Methylobacterium sp. J-030]MCJ2067750.1 phage tail tip lysozyme [Methylobacterium sp. J-030]